MSSQVEIPNFKLAKIGQRKERRASGLAWLFGGGKGAGGGALATGGAGAAGAATTVVKVAVAALVATMGAGAYQVGRSLAPDSDQYKAKPRAFAGVREKEAKYAEADLKNVKKSQVAGPSGLGLVSGARTGAALSAITRPPAGR